MSSLAAKLGVLRGQSGAATPATGRRTRSVSWDADAIERELEGEWLAEGVLRIRATVDAPLGDQAQIIADGDLPVCFLDTETTGLSGGVGTSIFLIGMAYSDGETWVLDQLLLARPGGEREFWEAAEDKLSHHCWVSYNGKSFDAPLIAARSRLRYGRELTPGAHIDLIHWLRRAFASRWPDCRLASAEATLLRQPRVNDLPGSMAPMAYQAFLRTGSTALLRRVVHHHRQDIVSLMSLRQKLEAVYRDPAAYDADSERIGTWWLEQGNMDHAAACLCHCNSDSARLRLASIHRQRNEQSSALQIWIELAARRNTEALLRLAIHAEHHDRDPYAALEWCAELIAIEPDCPHHRHRLERLQEKSRQYEFGRAGGSPRSVSAIRAGSRIRDGFCRNDISRAATKTRS